MNNNKKKTHEEKGKKVQQQEKKGTFERMGLNSTMHWQCDAIQNEYNISPVSLLIFMGIGDHK